MDPVGIGEEHGEMNGLNGMEPDIPSYGPGDDWDGMDVAELFAACTQMIETIDSHVEALAELTPVLKDKAEGYGLTLDTDYSALQDSLAKLVKKSPKGRRGSRRGRPKEGKERERRYGLVWSKNGNAVTDEAGEPILFKNKVQILRGPKYEALLGKKVKDVQLVDHSNGDEVVVDSLELGPAPGGRR